MSVVVPLYNSEGEVAAVMEEIAKQAYGDLEVLIVDDGSTDGTRAAAAAGCARFPGARVIGTAHGGASHARNAGLAEARGEVVFFMEADCTYSADYVSKAVGLLSSQPEVQAVCLTGAPLKLRSTLAVECIDVENKIQHRRLQEGKAKPFYAWVYRRAAIATVGGFDEKLFQGEDKDLFRRFEAAGNKVGWIPGVHWWHRRDQTLAEMTSKWFFRGRMRVLYALKHRLWKEIGRTLAPLWLTLLGLALLPAFPLVGGLLLAVVAAAVMASTARAAYYSWPDVKRKRVYLGYPAFAVARNFATAAGYSWALVAIAIRRVQGREVTWSSV